MYSKLLRNFKLSYKCLCRYESTVESQVLPKVAYVDDGISPPVKIKRGPTDILEALAATVGNDPTAAHYKYHDDPFLIPLSNPHKRSFALSAEAGRKAAAWVRDQHADLFTLREWDPPSKKKTPYFNADPIIKAFAPKPIYTPESKVTEEDLKYTIQNALLEDTIIVYELLGGADNINDELKLNLLQFLCFYNEKEPDSAEWLEERWFSTAVRERQATTWKLGGLADKIFTSMEPKTSEAYCAIIQGMAKYYQAEKAYMLTQEAIENGHTLSTSVYNSLISCVGFLKEGTALRIELLKQFLEELNKKGLAPNQETLTSCLKSISSWGSAKQLQTLALQILAEFKNLDIHPGLSAYYYLLCIFCKERGPRVNILTDILDDLEQRNSLDANEPTDTNFFITAMGVCSDHLHDISLAERLHKLLMKGDNYKLVGDAYKESIYYRHYMTVSCRHAPLEKTIELLDTLVPNVYIPEPSVMEEIIKCLEAGGVGARLAQAWSQLVIFGHAKRGRLVDRLLAALCNCYSYQDEEVKASMRTAAADVMAYTQLGEELDTRDMRTPQHAQLSAAALCSIVSLCTQAPERTDSAWEAAGEAARRLRGAGAAAGDGAGEALADAARRAAACGHAHIAATLVQYMGECGYAEGAEACVRALGELLRRDRAEVLELLASARACPAPMDPAAAEIVDAYHLCKSGAQDSSDSESSSDSE